MRVKLTMLLAVLSLCAVLALPASAQTVIPSTPYSTTLNVGGQSQIFFQYTAGPGETVTADTFGTYSGNTTYADTWLYVYDGSGILLAQNDDYSYLDSRVQVGPFAASTTLTFEVVQFPGYEHDTLSPFPSGTILYFNLTSSGAQSDTTAPVITTPGDLTVDPAGPDGAVVEYSASASDDVDGEVAVTCDWPSGSLFPIGSTLVTCSATDAAGNIGSASFTVTVLPLTVNGFYSPVDMGVANEVRGGRTVPLTFEVFVGSTELTDPAIVASFSVMGPDGDVEFTSPGGTGLRYDAEAGQLVTNWQVPTAPGYYEVTMTLVSGETLTAAFNVQ